MGKKNFTKEEMWARKASNFELKTWASLGQEGFQKLAAQSELDRRHSWREFLTSKLVGWIALAVSIISLGISLFR